MRSEEYKARQREQKRNEYHWYRNHGICVYCHQNDAVPGMQACADCFYKRQMKRIEKSGEAQRAKEAEQARSRRARHKAQGFCTECNRPALDGHTRCMKHAMLHRMYDRQSKVRIIPDLNVCSIVDCDEPIIQGKRYCEKHYKQKCAVMMANRLNDNSGHIWRKLDSAMFKDRQHIISNN